MMMLMMMMMMINDQYGQRCGCRPNLYLSVTMKHPDVMKDLRSQMAPNRNGDMEFDGPTIIYCPTKKSAETLTNAVKGENDILFNLWASY